MAPILLLGRQGQVGWELARTLAPLAPVIGLARDDLDLADPDAIRRAVRRAQPRLIVNAAAYTQVDKAETETELAMAINGTAPGILAEEAKRAGAALVHYSTDYVFAGSGDRPWREDDAVAPLNAYGVSKLAGEQAIAATGGRHLIFRTAWVYADRGRNFLKTMQRLALERDELRVVADQHGAPTWARLIAEATALVLAATRHRDGWDALAERGGLYHLTSGGQTTWCDFAEAIVAASAPAGERRARVVGIATSEYPTPAKRPAYSVLDCSRLADSFGIGLPDWRDGLALCLGD
ncbi:MAG: dTDP-4-dehydrorhamnose reductase [Rhodospirillales bacterium]